MEAQCQPFILNPTAWDWLEKAPEAMSDLLEERPARVSGRMSVSKSGALELQTVVANIDQARQPYVPFEVSKSPAAHKRDPRSSSEGQLSQEMLGPRWKADLPGMLNDRREGPIVVEADQSTLCRDEPSLDGGPVGPQ
jgi:hypothetical protein